MGVQCLSCVSAKATLYMFLCWLRNQVYFECIWKTLARFILKTAIEEMKTFDCMCVDYRHRKTLQHSGDYKSHMYRRLIRIVALYKSNSSNSPTHLSVTGLCSNACNVDGVFSSRCKCRIFNTWTVMACFGLVKIAMASTLFPPSTFGFNFYAGYPFLHL